MILTVNAGSSSVKLAAFAGEQARATKVIDLGAGVDHDRAIARGLAAIVEEIGSSDCQAVGHRVVHGGELLGPRLVDASLVEQLRGLSVFAPLHQSHNLAAIAVAQKLLPGARHVACFDTSFHRTVPDLAREYALPRELNDLVAYGFHGLSYEYIASVLPEYLGSRADRRVVVAHLGSGASMCAMLRRTSIATTMGLTPLDGLVMATRAGALDPGLVLHLIEDRGMSAREVHELLYEKSGLLGISGTTGQMRELLVSGEPAARHAVNMFIYRAVRTLGSLAAALGGLDAVVFTGGIGENAPVIRDRIMAGIRWLGDVVAVTIPTNEELVIARHARRFV